MTKRCQLRITEEDYRVLHSHLFSGDEDEHGAVVKAGLMQDGDLVRLLVREVHPAVDGLDYTESKVGYRALQPTFIHRHITRCRDERLVYLAVHNHGSDLQVSFSGVDLASHKRGYPALLDIAGGMPVGALVFGRRSIEADIWLPTGERLPLEEAVLIGSTIRQLYARQPLSTNHVAESFNRQVQMFGHTGQQRLAKSKIGIIGVGGVGSLVAEYLARLGVGHIVLVDPDAIEESNLSRVVGATVKDVKRSAKKVDIAKRHLSEVHPPPSLELLADDFAQMSVAARLRACDYLFLAADSMRARLVFNAMVHQFLIPGVQLGSKVRAAADGSLHDAMSVNRPVRPGQGCLWCNGLIDPTQLAIEAKTDVERKAQAYGTEQPNPSVITLNAVAAAHGANDFLFDFLGLRPDSRVHEYEHFHFLKQHSSRVLPRRDADCPECGRDGKSRFAMGDATSLPCLNG